MLAEESKVSKCIEIIVTTRFIQNVRLTYSTSIVAWRWWGALSYASRWGLGCLIVSDAPHTTVEYHGGDAVVERRVETTLPTLSVCTLVGAT